MYLHLGDSREVLKSYPDNSIDSIVCDPPYALTSISKRWAKGNNRQVAEHGVFNRVSRGFMGKQWDNGSVAFDPEFWQECLRVLKPGGFVLSMGSTRTYHRLVCAIEDAGFEVKDTLGWIFGSGFPKSRNISKDLLAMTSCNCEGTEISSIASIDTSAPPVNVGTGTGTKPALMSLTGLVADHTRGHSLEAGSVSSRQSVSGNEQHVEEIVGNGQPVMLGTFDMTSVAEDGKIGDDIGLIEIEPEPLRDNVMTNEIVSRPTISTSSGSGDNSLRDCLPIDAFVPPFPTSPDGVSFPDHSGLVVGSHAGTGTVNADTLAESNEAISTDDTDTSIHYHQNSTTGFICPNCGKVKKNAVPDGFGTALKPAMELICLARKPLSEKSVAANVARWGTGALNIDGCRVPTGDKLGGGASNSPDAVYTQPGWVRPWMSDPESQEHHMAVVRDNIVHAEALGRWPANVTHDGSDEVLELFPAKTKSRSGGTTSRTTKADYRMGALPRTGHDDEGSAARFFYCAKASVKEREFGLDAEAPLPLANTNGDLHPSYADYQGKRPGTRANNHPTCKPLALMRYLIKLVTPPGGIVLDPFMGSGSTGVAAAEEGFNFVGVEQDASYFAISEKRIAAVAAASTSAKNSLLDARMAQGPSSSLYSANSTTSAPQENP